MEEKSTSNTRHGQLSVIDHPLNKVSNIAQLGGIETSVLDNGRGRGTRIAWVNSGGGLRFKVVIDRAMDIMDASFDRFNLSWISRLGLTAPQSLADKGTDWLRTFGGGLLTTCGLAHTGGPETDAFGHRGLHDQISNIPAEIVSIKQPDLTMEDGEMSITGRMLQGHPLGHNLELTRTIRCHLGDPTLHIADQVRNVGNTDAPHMLLYHFNFGWPLVDAGTKILWNGEWRVRHPGEEYKIFREGNDFRTCPEPLEEHRGGGEEVAIISPEGDGQGNCRCGLLNEKLGIIVEVAFKKEQLPWLANWQHWGPGEYVTGLEPGTHPIQGQKKAREDGDLIFLKPGEKRVYELSLSVSAI